GGSNLNWRYRVIFTPALTWIGAGVHIWLVSALVGAALAAACSGGGTQNPVLSPGPSPGPTASQDTSGTQTSQSDARAAAIERSTVLLDDPVPNRLTYGWETNFDLHSVPYSEIVSGGPPRDGIPPIDSPVFFIADEAPDYMRAQEPVIALEIGGEAKAYPLAMLIRHEIVNDVLGGIPVAVTYCPLCNTALVFNRRVGERVLDFGTSGNVRKSDLVMWDRQTESWWQQITGEAIVGDLTGTRLKVIAAQILSFSDFRDAYPEALVLSRETGIYPAGTYEVAPYAGYDREGGEPFLFGGDVDPRLPAVERVLTIEIAGEAIAFPFSELRSTPVINDAVGGREVVVFYTGETLSPFAGIAAAPRRPVGSTGVFDPVADGLSLTFTVSEGIIIDEQTGSAWSILGEALTGPLAGTKLEPIVHGNHFWFAWAAFRPDTAVRGIESHARP
ncbi:MAG: DUF3179 domain-containing (seleno)protein, partial [Dehalococcoidia bacterium]|nr:DUF3179 domain-containing (seleno)protein [Dehalococcoidia bacterium]